LHPIIIGDRWYACAPFLARLSACFLAEVSPTYRLRYSHEHGYCFQAQDTQSRDP
jgi:hypothetical protein